jgi:hypothetical protein
MVTSSRCFSNACSCVATTLVGSCRGHVGVCGVLDKQLELLVSCLSLVVAFIDGSDCTWLTSAVLCCTDGAPDAGTS